jgi:hypothetical protein
MTSIWGPMGWMTLHSISLLYPESPTAEDKQIVKTFLNDFAESITCPHCERHFKIMFENYKITHRDWADSRFNLFMFIARCHNTVNKRLEKPLKNSVQECLESISASSQYTSLTEFRRKYIDYVIRRMSAEMSGDNLVKVGFGKSMKRINESYWNSKLTTETSTFDMSADVLEFIADEPRTVRYMFGGSSSASTVVDTASIPSLGFRGGRLRLTTR